MVGRKKKTKICDNGSHEDRISKLPDTLICEILSHISTKDAVRTSVLSTRWRSLWKSVLDMDLNSHCFSDFNAMASFFHMFIDFQRDLWIRKLRVKVHHHDCNSYLISWIDVATTHGIQHLDVHYEYPYNVMVPLIPLSLSIYTCETLVHLRLCRVALVNAEFVFLPRLKIIHLEYIRSVNKATFEKLISGSVVLEDLRLIRCSIDNENLLLVHSLTLKRIHIDGDTLVVIDAPLLQCLKTKICIKRNYKIINMDFSAKLDIDVDSNHAYYNDSLILDILPDILRVKDLVTSDVIWKVLYSRWGVMFQFLHLSHLNVKISKSELEILPTILENCPKLKSLILEIVKDPLMRYKKNREPKVMFSKVPRCLVSSLKVVKLKRLFPRYEGELELVRYFLKNSTILEKLRLDAYYTKKARGDKLLKILASPRCSTICEIIFPFQR